MIGPMPQFWADDFDTDLLKVFPDLQEILGGMAFLPLWTLGHTTFGRLNHPTVWNTHGAYLWLEKPDLPRDEHGWTNVGGCVTNDPIVECIWIEWLRDIWVHCVPFVVLPVGVRFVPEDWGTFEDIMYHLRGWQLDGRGCLQARNATRRWVMTSSMRLSYAMDKLNATSV